MSTGVTLESVYEALQQAIALANQILSSSSRITPGQVDVKVLSDLSGNLGTVTAGEFRSGQGIPNNPTAPFTGVRIGHPGFTYNGEEYAIVGVNTDIIQFGMKVSDGKIYAGKGNTILDSDGLKLLDGSTPSSSVTWHNSTDNVDTGIIYGDQGYVWITAVRLPGASWTVAHVILEAVDVVGGVDARLEINTSDGGRLECQNVILYPLQASAAPSYHEGGMYYDTTLHKLRIGGAAGWETITSV